TDVSKFAMISVQGPPSQESRDDRDDRQKQSAESTVKTVAAATLLLDAKPRFETHLVTPAEPARPATPAQDLPQMPAHPSAHRVSIDIGENESKVIVTLHERAGDVSVKVHA